jgi:hypothetical protein
MALAVVFAMLLLAPSIGGLNPVAARQASTDVDSLLSSAQQDGLPAALHAGNCDEIGPEIAALTPAFVPSSTRAGSAQSLPGANSFSAVTVSLDAMLAEDHAVVVSGAVGEPIACGEVGGYPTETGALIIGLRSEPSTGISGVAFLNPSDAPTQTNISLFLTGDALGDDAAGPVEASSQSDETPVAEDEASEQSDGAEPTAVPTKRPAPTPTPVPAPGSSQSNPAPIGTTLETQGLAVTVNSAYFDYGFANAIPRGGYKVMILGVTIENVSDENRGYAASRFGGIDAVTGNTYNPVTLDDVGVLLTDGDLQPGEFVSGTVLIEVQETATNVIVKYDADILGDEDLYWS